MEEIEIREEGGSQFTIRALIKEIKNSFLLIVAITLLCTAIGGVFGKFFVKTTYVSKASLMVSSTDQGGGNITQSKELATTMKAFLDSTNKIIFQQVETDYNSEHHEGKISAKELESSLGISVNTVMMDLTLTTTNKDAKQILQKVIENMIAAVNENKDGEYTYEEFAGKLKITSPASDAESDAGSKVFKYMAIFFILGAFGSLLFVLLKILLNDTYSDKDLFEADLGIEVLSMIEAVSPAKNKNKEAN